MIKMTWTTATIILAANNSELTNNVRKTIIWRESSETQETGSNASISAANAYCVG